MAATANNPRSEKAQNLPLLCVETILKFTPTSKIIRLYSNAVPLPGPFWSCGIEAVLKKRLPLSLRDVPSCFWPFEHCSALFDVSGAKIATLKKPDMFRLCPLREFVESTTLTLRVTPKYGYDGPLQSRVLHGDALLSHMPNIVHLALVVPEVYFEREGDLFKPLLKDLLPQLQSFEVSMTQECLCMSDWQEAKEAFANFTEEARIVEMSRLQRLVLPVAAIGFLARTTDNHGIRMQAVLAGLSSLGINENVSYGPARIGEDSLFFVSRCCAQLSQLQVIVDGEFGAYLAAFRALQRLTSLGLNVLEADLTGFVFSCHDAKQCRKHFLFRLTFDGSEAISSVSDFRVVCSYRSDCTTIFKMTTFFPNARAVALKADVSTDPLKLATCLFGESQPFPVVAKLSYFYSGGMLCLSSQEITQFLANPHLPETVDLSQNHFQHEHRAKLMIAIYSEMQANSIRRLLLRGPVHREALLRLQSHIDLNGEGAKVSAWKDRDLGDQPSILYHTEISQQTDFKIIGLKTSGNLKGERFTIRVFHLLAKRADIFE